MKFLRPLLFAASVAVIAAFTVPISLVAGAVIANVAAIEPVLAVLFVLAVIGVITSLVLHIRTIQPFQAWLATWRMPLAPDRSPPD